MEIVHAIVIGSLLLLVICVAAWLAEQRRFGRCRLSRRS